ncbi:MAG: cation transporter [candidate division NC10 bacterium]
MREATPEERLEFRQVAQLTTAGLFSVIPLVALYLAISILSGSLTILAVTFDCGLSLVVYLFLYASMRIMEKQNIFTFPYGPGKLENFSGFLYGALVIPASLYVIGLSCIRLLHPPEAISLGISQLPLLPSVVRSLLLLRFTLGLRRRNRSSSPVLDLYYNAYRADTYFNTGVAIALGLAFFLDRLGHHTLAYTLDPAVSALLALNLLRVGIGQVLTNFRALVDLPLAEEAQLKILSVLTREFTRFEDVGNIRTRSSGKNHVIEIEVYFGLNRSYAEVMAVRDRLESGLREQFTDLDFGMIPLLARPAAT